MKDYIKEIEVFKELFEKKYCNNFGYNYNYNLSIQESKLPTLSYVAYHFVDLFYNKLTVYLKDK